MTATTAGALTPADYVSAVAFDREARGLFAVGWIAVCRSEEVAGAGAQKAVMAATTPVLIVRLPNGAAAALSNVCRHRALTLVEGETTGMLVRCPYHLWAYGLDGKLEAAPFMDGVDLTGCDLPTYAAAEWGGWVFVNLDGKAEPLAALMAPLAADIGPERLAGWTVGFRLGFEHDWNWKVMVENFSESYHHIGAHRDTLQPLWPGGQSDSSASTDRWIELRHTDHPDAGTLNVFTVFPFFMLALSDPGESAFWYRMVPLGPERIALEIVGLFPPEVAEFTEAMEGAKAQILAVHMEDIPMCERVQAGLRAPDAMLGPLSPLEAGLARFRAWASRAGRGDQGA